MNYAKTHPPVQRNTLHKITCGDCVGAHGLWGFDWLSRV